MANSVVKVTDSMLNDSLLLLVGEDGTVTPDKNTVESYLNSKTTATNIQVMQINKSDGQSIDVAVNNVVYLPDSESVENVEAVTLATPPTMDEVALNLHNIKLDHDYTKWSDPPEEIDELAKTLSILDGHEPEPEPEIVKPQKIVVKDESSTVTTPKPKLAKQVKNIKKVKPVVETVEADDAEDDEEDEEEYSDEDYEDELEDDDSDFELTETKVRRPKKPVIKTIKTRPPKIKTPPKVTKVVKLEPEVTNNKVEKEKEKEKLPEVVPQTPPPVSQVESKGSEKKVEKKKEKKTPKPIPDDFALFSTPDIIRRVGGKESATPENVNVDQSKPAKIDIRSKSMTESPSSIVKPNRLSLDGKVPENKSPVKVDTGVKSRERKLSDSKNHHRKPSTESPISVKKPSESSPNKNQTQSNQFLGEIPGADDLNAMIGDEAALVGDQNNLNLDGTGLDLDPSLLENINNDLISEDILYQVAQSLVSNTELQNAIDKSLNEGNLVLDPPLQEQIMVKEPEKSEAAITQQEASSSTSHKQGTQIVRPDGRIVVIPPIERPTTRSRNKKEAEKPTPKFTHKPLDEEHVSGNELDSSGEEEEESEDDPNKLWCICNQPHNNRFMICCDTCEEWYHGKCVNITKAMGQQMESEGREWICLFCKDPLLNRPQAAARRIRKASRNSRQSSDSAGSSKIADSGTSSGSSSGSVPCVVCQKASRSNSIFCSESCILAHAQGVERVVVFERSTGNMLTGNKAPSAANLEQWLKDHPGYEVVRSAGKIVTTKQSQNLTQSKLKIVKNTDNDGVSLAVHKKGIHVGVLKHLPKAQSPVNKTPNKATPTGFKIISKQVSTTPQKPKIVPPHKIQTPPPNLAKTKAPVTPKLTPPTTSTPVHREKPMPAKTPKARQAEQVTSTPQPKQENIRENVQKTVFEQLTNRLKLVDDLKLSEDEVKSISVEIESQLYKCFGDTGQKYRNKYRSLIFNIKDMKNQTLWRRICEKSINPYQLVRLSPDDLASQELALWREREAKHQLDMIKKSELELLNCNRQYVLKTHKGEQILEDNRPTDNIDNTEVITSLTDGTVGEKHDSKRDSSKDRDRKSSKHSHKDKERKSSKDKADSKEHHSHRSSSKEHDRSRKRSRSRDRNSKHSDRKRSRSRGRDKHRKSSHKSSRHKKEQHRGSSADKLDKKSKEILEQLVDNKIVPPLEDRLWKHVSQEDILPTSIAESDSDHEPTSTVTIPTPPRNNEADECQSTQSSTESRTEKEKLEPPERSSSPVSKARSEEIWRGVINMVDVAQISITAHEVSGDCHGLGAELPANLDIVGRISPDTVWDYIGKMRCSNSKIISLVRLNAINIEEKMPYLALYGYLSSRNRLGVVKSINKAVKDFYILPLASQKPIPQALLPINGPGFEEARPALLLGIIVRDKRKRPLLDPISPLPVSVKKPKVEAPVVQAPARSYTPPPVKDIKSTLPLPPSLADEDDDEPYSPEDSDPDSATVPSSVVDTPNASFLDSSTSSQSFQPFASKFENIPGLSIPGIPTLPSSTQEFQRQMEKLNKQIEMQKSEIDSISQNIASTEIGTSALANIALPSNLQQILDSIKTIGAVSSTDTPVVEATASTAAQESSDLTIPLILPTTFSRPLGSTPTPETFPEDTIPLNLPSKKKTADVDKSGSSVLGSLSEEDLIRKAEEMLGESSKSDKPPVKRVKIDLDLPPVPGLDDDN